MTMRKIHIIDGGTVAHIRPHLALCAPAYGATVRDLFHILYDVDFQGVVMQYTTKMAGNRQTFWSTRSGTEAQEPLNLETNEDIAALLACIVADPEPSIVFLPAALCDFDVDTIDGAEDMTDRRHVGKQYGRLSSRVKYSLNLTPAAKVIQQVRKTRKDIFLVGFKTTTGAEKQDQFNAGLELMKKSSCNLVLANDLVTKLNMVITPEQAPYYVSTDRRHVLRQLVGMTLERSRGHFTRSTVVDGPLVPWDEISIPSSLHVVVNHCVKRGAYKPFMGKTVGHFAFKAGPGYFVTSRRGVNFNELDKAGMVRVTTKGDDEVLAMGAKPSVGGQSQRIIFANHPDVDCIVHFHCPLKSDAEGFPTRSQGPYECGSHECGKNTSDGLEPFFVDNSGRKIKAVMLDKHGPNIVFHHDADPQAVIRFIEEHWDLGRVTSEVP